MAWITCTVRMRDKLTEEVCDLELDAKFESGGDWRIEALKLDVVQGDEPAQVELPARFLVAEEKEWTRLDSR